MIPMAAIMTIDVRLEYVADVRQPGGAYFLREHEPGDLPRLSALVITEARTGGPDAHSDCMDLAMKWLRETFPDHVLCLLVGHWAWYPDTRVVNYFRLWRGLLKCGIQVPPGRDREEWAIHDERGVRWFGHMVVQEDEAPFVMGVIREEPASLLVCVSERVHGRLTEELASGWNHPTFGPDLVLTHRITETGGMVVVPVGAFDDPEFGQVIIGDPGRIDQLLSRSGPS